MPWVSFVFLMGHMLVSHIYRELYSQPGVVDVTGAQMVLVMKVRRHMGLWYGQERMLMWVMQLTAFCWSVHDGRIPKSVRLNHSLEPS